MHQAFGKTKLYYANQVSLMFHFENLALLSYHCTKLQAAFKDLDPNELAQMDAKIATVFRNPIFHERNLNKIYLLDEK